MTASLTPDTIGGYRLVERAGEGGMGVVYRARDRAGREVALKVLRPHVIGDDESRQRLAREVTSLRRIRSPRVAEVYDGDPWGPTPYLVTRFVSGPSLQDQVRGGNPVIGERLVKFAHELAAALAAVHEADVLHRDVKPSNVLMEAGHPVLIDFGIAQLTDDSSLTMVGWMLGTPGYIAPEVLHGAQPTASGDVHGWAATVIYAATGECPFGTGSVEAIMDRVRRNEYLLPELSPRLRPLVVEALRTEPSRRPSASELVSRLEPPERGSTLPAMDPAVLDAAPLDAVVPNDWGRSGAQLKGDASRATEAGRAESWGEADVDGADGLVVTRSWSYIDESAVVPEPPRLRAGLLWLALAGVLGALVLLSPPAAVGFLFVGTWFFRTATERHDAIVRRRASNGIRRSDPIVATLALPLYLALALPGTVVNVLVAVVVAAVVLVLAIVLAPPIAETAAIMLSGLVVLAAVWWGAYGRDLRAAGRRAALGLTRSRRWVALAVATALVVAVALFGAYRQASPNDSLLLPPHPWRATLVTHLTHL